MGRESSNACQEEFQIVGGSDEVGQFLRDGFPLFRQADVSLNSAMPKCAQETMSGSCAATYRAASARDGNGSLCHGFWPTAAIASCALWRAH